MTTTTASSTGTTTISTGASSVGTTITEELLKEVMKQHLSERKAAKAEATPTPPTPAVPKKEPVLKDGQRWFSDVFGVKPKVDFGVTVKELSSIPPEVVAFIPEEDTTYVLQIEEAARVARAIENGDKILCTGPTGSGKSSLFKYVCSKLNYPMIRLNMTGDVESSSIFGQLTVAGGATVWVDGAATEAVMYGAMLVIDEWEVTPPEIMFGFQNLLEDGGYLFLKEKPGTSADKTIHPHANFRMACLGNTVGQGDDTGRYSGTNVQNSATLDRFQTTVVLDYLSEMHEAAIITSTVPDVHKDTAKKMCQFAKAVRQAHNTNQINLTMSPRTLINWGRKIVDWDGDIKQAITIAFLDKMRDTDRKVVSALYEKVFGRV